MDKLIFYILSIGILLLVVSAVWPYWDKYLIKSDLKEAALYGTKHSVEDTQSFLSEKLKERGCAFDPSELHIEKYENKTVSIKFTYKDEISLFDIVLKEIEFKLAVTERHINEYL